MERFAQPGHNTRPHVSPVLSAWRAALIRGHRFFRTVIRSLSQLQPGTSAIMPTRRGTPFAGGGAPILLVVRCQGDHAVQGASCRRACVPWATSPVTCAVLVRWTRRSEKINAPIDHLSRLCGTPGVGEQNVRPPDFLPEMRSAPDFDQREWDDAGRAAPSGAAKAWDKSAPALVLARAGCNPGVTCHWLEPGPGLPIPRRAR
jgi:hypothetical protein